MRSYGAWAVVALIAPLLVGAAPSATRPLDVDVERPGRSAYLSAHLADVTTAEEFATASQSTFDWPYFGSYWSAEPVGDLDGDGASDLVVITDDDVVGHRLRALRGSDGRELWSLQRLGGVHVAGARVGPDAVPGVYVIEHATTWLGAAGSSETIVSAIGGAGRTLWERTYRGIYAVNPGVVSRDLTYAGGTMQATRSPAQDLLLRQVDVTSKGSASTYGVTGIVLDGADGSEAVRFETTNSSQESILTPTPDVTGDGIEDIIASPSGGVEVCCAPSTGDREPQGRGPVSLHRGSDGSEAWRRDDVPVGVFPSARWLGDADGDRTPDVAIIGDGGWGAHATNASLLSGRDGRTWWSARADVVAAAGDIDGDRRLDVALAVMRVDDAEGTVAFRYWALGAGGGVRYRREHVHRLRSDVGGHVSMGPAGDVDGDGREDAFHNYAVAPRYDDPVVDRAIVASRDGSTISTQVPGEFLRASVDGRGDDAWMADTNAYRTAIRVRDGRTGKELWTAVVSRSREPYAGPYLEQVRANDLDRDGHADIIASLWGERGAEVVVIDGATGRERWRSG